MKKGVTIVDIAKKLNMSPSTVSKALSNHYSISSLTRERVKELANKWNYVANESARSFKQNKSFTIALIIPDLLDQFYVMAINGVEAIAKAKGYNVIISQSHENPEIEVKTIESYMSKRIDGVIIAVCKETKSQEKLKQLVNMGIHVVCFSRSTNDDLIDSVSTDNEDGVFKGIKLLVKKGHKKIAHIMGPKTLLTSHIRLEAYKNALIKNKIAYDESLVKETDFSKANTEKIVRELLLQKDPPTGFFMFKNYISIDAINFIAQKYPLKLKKIDIVGFGNFPLIKWLTNKPLASIDENSFIMGERAANLLFEKIEAIQENINSGTTHIKVPCKLILNK